MADSIHGTPVYGSAQGVQIAACLDVATPSSLRHRVMTLEITIEPGLHVYGQPIPEGFIPLSIDVAPVTGLVMGAPAFPPPMPHQMEGLEEEFFIYEGTFSVVIPLTLPAEAPHAALDIRVRYQACGEMGCFMPQTVALRLPV